MTFIPATCTNDSKNAIRDTYDRISTKASHCSSVSNGKINWSMLLLKLDIIRINIMKNQNFVGKVEHFFT